MLSTKAKAGVTSAHRHVEILELRNTISKNLSELRQSQHVYMPGLASILDETRDSDVPDDPPKLWLPSEVSAEDRDTWCLPDIPSLEFRFRYAQADDSLAELRRLRRLVQGLQDQNAKHPSLTQKSLTRSQGLWESFRARIKRSASRYSHALSAMLALDPDEKLSPGWTRRFQKLNDGDIRGPGREASDTSEGRFVPSWIWLVPHSNHLPTTTTAPDNPATRTNTPAPDHETATMVSEGTAVNDAEFVDSMRVHWAKCQARAERYEEEVQLTIEEMGRTLSYFKWKQSWWLGLASERANSDASPQAGVQRGLHAYAHRQASIYGVLVVSFVSRWRKSLLSHGFKPVWLSQYPAVADSLPSRPSRGHSKQKTDFAAGTSACEPAHTDSDPRPLSPQYTSETVDAPLASEAETGDEGDDYIIDEAEGFDLDD